jgi:P-type Mg2+ transporter
VAFAKADESIEFEKEFANLPEEIILQKLGSSLHGLSSEEVEKRLSLYGYNEASHKKEKPAIVQLLSKLKNPLILLLIFVATISLIMNQIISAVFVFAMAVISILITFFQEYRANNEAKKLSEMVSSVTTVIRNNESKEMNMRYLVPGDIVHLSVGDIVPADIRILSAKDVYIDQATLTGESFPVEKTSEQVQTKECTVTELTNIAFMGTHVISGTAIGIVLQTGSKTQFGNIATRVIEQNVDTNFDKGVRSFVLLMINLIVGLILAIFAINAVLKQDVLQALLFSLAVAVGLTPEMLPMIISVNLSNGAIKMSKQKVIVKRLSAIQNFGAMDVLCTDKTGTLTLGEVVLVKHFDLKSRESEEVLEYAYLNSHFQTGLKNLLDTAILDYKHLDVGQFQKVDEIPFDFSRKMMSVVVEKRKKHILIAKGAPEEIIERCSYYEIDGIIKKLNKRVLQEFIKTSDSHRNQGFRVLALAYKDFEKKKTVYEQGDETDLVLKGFMIFLDPPKPSARHAIQALQKLGITLKILTGDNELVTKNICSKIGIEITGVVTGNAIDGLTDEQLEELVEKISIFARLTPVHKERIICALKKNGHTVGYLGDGINDAPSFKNADVSISVDNAVDIAKETADIILLEKSLDVLAEGAVEGRKTYSNIVKYIKMGAGSNFGNMFSFTGASLFLPFLPMLPIQILLNNFLYDLSQMSIPSDDVDIENVQKPTPWNVGYIKKVMFYFGPLSSIFDFITFAILLFMRVDAPTFWTVWFLESLFSQTLVIYVIRTAKIPFIESRPSNYLLFTSIIMVSLGLLITLTPIGLMFGFVHLPVVYLGIIALIVIVYLISAQRLKVWFIKKYGYA